MLVPTAFYSEHLSLFMSMEGCAIAVMMHMTPMVDIAFCIGYDPLTLVHRCYKTSVATSFALILLIFNVSGKRALPLMLFTHAQLVARSRMLLMQIQTRSTSSRSLLHI